MNEDRAIGEDQPIGIDATSSDRSVDDFDFGSWLAGVRPTRRAVQLYARGDLVARLDELEGRIDAATDDEADDLLEEFERLRAEFRDGRWFIVEARSPEWVEEYRKRHTGKGKISEAGQVQILIGQLAEQIVQPRVTAEQLSTLYDRNPGELNKLVVAMTFANNQVAESAGSLTRDFSSRRSGSTRR